jgi:GNAT superfamily N-acetyltransferase
MWSRSSPTTPGAGLAVRHGEGRSVSEQVTLRLLSSHEAREQIGALSAVLIDCVEGGASVSFMAPLPQEKANAFWRGVAEGVAAGTRILVVAQDRSSGQIVGTVQVVLGQPENQPHRADVSKMLVHRQARRRGVGAALMRAAEDAARTAGKSLLVLDTATGSDAERLYERLGWTKAGVIPNYALWPRGGFCDTTIFYKQIAGG